MPLVSTISRVNTISRVATAARNDVAGRAVAAMLAVGFIAGGMAPGVAAADGDPPDFADLAERLNPAVVNISSSQVQPGGGAQVPQFPPGSPFEEFFKDFFDRRGGGGEKEDAPAPRATSLGSGFVVDSEGYLITNNHVIADADEINVTFADGTTLKAEVIGHDPKTDVALLKVEPSEPLVAVDWGDSNTARVGNWVLAIGNPFGLGNTVTAGIISALARDINAGPFDDFLQTDAAINRGNSGGPLFNLKGEVIGINTAIYSPSGGSVGVGFAVPSNLASNVAFQLREFGETRRGWLGVRIQTVTEDLAETLGLDQAGGALVASITESSPAEEAGLLVGDVIVQFDGKSVESMRRLPRIVAETRIGKKVDVELWREGEKVTVGVVVGRLDETDLVVASARSPAEEPTIDDVPSLGLTLSTLTRELRAQFTIDASAHGVMVVKVDGGGLAAEKGIRPGDIIVEVAQEEVSSPGEVADRIKEQKAAKKKTVLLLLDRKGDLQFVAVRLENS